MGSYSGYGHGADPDTSNGQYTKEVARIQNVVRGTVSQGKSLLYRLSRPIRANYIVTRKFAFTKYVTPDRLNNNKMIQLLSDEDERSDYIGVCMFHLMFNNKSGIYEYKFGEHFKEISYHAPDNGFYFKILDKKDVCLCFIESFTPKDNDNGTASSNHHTITFYFIGPNCHYWETHHYSKAKYIENKNKNNAEKYNRQISIPSTTVRMVTISTRSNFDISIRPKTIDEVFFHDLDIRDVVLKKIDTFSKSGKFYKRHRIPYRLGALIYGPPGTGKTTLSQVIASRYNVDIIILTPEIIFNHMSTGEPISYLSNFYFNNAYMDNIRSVILIEEIDSLMGTSITLEKTGGKLRKDQLTRFIDSLPEGCIVIATTNIDIDDPKNKNIIDPALIRPGRFDIKLKMDCFDKDAAIRMIESHGLDKSFANNYQYPLSPSELQFDIAQNLMIKNLEKMKEDLL